jgi:hypothetical protein
MPAKAGRGRVIVQSKINGKIVSAHARMLVGRDYAVEFEAGEEVSADAGAQKILVTLLDNSVLVDKPTLQLEVPIEPGKLSKVDAAFPWAKVQLNVLLHGSVQPPTAVKLIRNGEVVAEVKSGAPAFLVSPGNYEADIPVRGKTRRVKDLVFFESTEQIVPVRAQL